MLCFSPLLSVGGRIAIRTFIEVILPVVVSQEPVLRGLEVVFRDRLQPRRVLEAVVEPKGAIGRFRGVGQRLFEIRLAMEQAREAGKLIRASDRRAQELPRVRIVFGAVFAVLDDLGEADLGLLKDAKSSGRKSEREAARQVLEGAGGGSAGRRVLVAELWRVH